MTPARIALVSDLHIGPYAAPGKTPTPYLWVEEFTSHIVNASPDLILIAGDIFDRRDGNENAVQAAQRMFDRFTEGGRPVAVIAGNHDAAVPEAYGTVVARDDLIVFPADAPATQVVSLQTANSTRRIALHGVSVQEPDDLRDVVPLYPAPVADAFNIGMMHSSLGGEWSNRACLPAAPHSLVQLGYDVWILGHVHEQRFVHEDPLVLYPGGAHPKFVTKRRELTGRADVGFLLLELSNPSYRLRVPAG